MSSPVPPRRDALPAPTPGHTTGLVLAGGRGTRMGGVDKGLQPFQGRPMVAHVIERLAPQVNELLVNANRNAEAYAGFGHRVIADEIAGFAGPLAGFLGVLIVTAKAHQHIAPAHQRGA